MEIAALNPLPADYLNKTQQKKHTYFQSLLEELRQRELPDAVIGMINEQISAYNNFVGAEKGRRKQLYKSKNAVFRLLEKEMKIVPKNMYLTRWMALGMAALGIPMGVAFGAAMGNMGLLGLGIPIGMGTGLAIGAGLDAKAAKEGRQLSVPFK